MDIFVTMPILKAIRIAWVPLFVAWLAPSPRAQCDTAWDWACEHVDDCRRHVFGEPASWSLQPVPSPVISRVVVALWTDNFLDARLLVGLPSPQGGASVELLVADGSPVFEQLVSLRHQLPLASPREIFDKVKVRVATLDKDASEALVGRIVSLRQVNVDLPVATGFWLVHVHGLSARVYVDMGMAEYLFDLNLPRTDSTAAPTEALHRWAWELARFLDAEIGLSQGNGVKS